MPVSHTEESDASKMGHDSTHEQEMGSPTSKLSLDVEIDIDMTNSHMMRRPSSTRQKSLSSLRSVKSNQHQQMLRTPSSSRQR